MLELLTALWLAFIGACIGSFLNVVAYRSPRGMSVVWKPSHCPNCGHDIRPRDNLPVLGWLLLRGRCRDCGEPISPRYAIVEAAMGAAFFILAYVELFTGAVNLPGGPLTKATGAWNIVWDPNWEIIGLYAYHALLLSLLMAMALIDLDRQRTPRRLFLLGLMVIGVAAYNWWQLYPERTRTIRIRELKSLLDAFNGVAWGAIPWAVAALVVHRRGKGSLVVSLINTAAALGTVGGFLGIRAVFRIAVMGLVGPLLVRLIQRTPVASASLVMPVWIATLVHIIFWKQLADFFSW